MDTPEIGSDPIAYIIPFKIFFLLILIN